MGKAKPGQNKDLNSIKQQLHTIKNGSVKKDKNPKFKNTPEGKVALINNSKAQNKNTSPQKNFQKDAGLKNNQNLSKNSAKESKRNSAKNKQNSPNKAQNKPANKKINLNPKKELEEIDDSDSDIDEDITLQEDVSLIKLGETSEDEEESDTDIPDILGKSLEDESDEDDEDFDEEEEEDEEDDDDDIKGETVERINVKTFEGVKPKVKKNDDKDNKNKIDRGQTYLMAIKDQAEQLLTMKDDDDNDEDNDDEDEEDEFESDEDEDFEEEEEEEDDDGDDNIEEETVEHKGVKMFKGVKTKVKDSDEDENEDDDDDDEDEDEEDEEDEENEEDEDSTLGLKALLGNNITDEDDDEDFNEEDEDDEDDDISDEDEDGEENDNVVKVTKEKAAKSSNSKDIPKEHKQVKEGKEKLSPEEQEEIDKRTIFIDNVPIKETSKADIKHHFGKFGPINNLRIRSIIPQDPKMSKKLAAIRKQIHPTAPTVVVYINYKSQESAQKALCMNGKIFRGNYIHVDIAHKSAKKRDNKKAVFIGNLKWGMDNNSIWKHFGKCGEIESVHLIRDKQTGQTKGFGYVNFKTEESAVLALKLDGDEILNRPIRVKPCLSVENKKGKKRVSSNNDGNPQKKLKNNLEKPVPRKAENEANINKHKKLQKNNEKPEEQKSISFQGQKADSKNKKKENKFDKKKKEMAKKLTAKSNKPVKI